MTGQAANQAGATTRGSALMRMFAGRSRGLTGAILFFSALANILMLTGPIYMLQIYGRVLSSGSVRTLVALTGLIAVLYAMLAILEGFRSALLARLGWRFARQYSDRVYDAAHRSTLDEPAGIGRRALADLNTVKSAISSPIVTAILDTPWTPIFLLVIFMMHPMLGWLSLGGGIVLVILALWSERTSRKALTDAAQQGYETRREGEQAMGHAETVSALGMHGRLKQHWMSSQEGSSSTSAVAAEVAGRFAGATKALRLLLQSAVLGLGAYYAIRGEINAGMMIAASIIMGRALAPIEVLVSQWRTLVQARASAGRLEALLQRHPPQAERMQLPPLEGRVSLHNAAIAPPGERVPILRGVSFELAAGEALGIIGPSAAGKSSLAKALIGAWVPLAGEIRLDEASASDWTSDELGRQIGFMPQETVFFNATVAANIARLDPDAQSEDIIAAAREAGCHEMILHLPDGYDTELGESGRALSAGQAQSIALARAIYGNPALVILDEPNSNLDARGDASLASAILSLKTRGATVIVIAHRPSALAHVDKILMLKDGVMADFGPRDEVLGRVTRSVSGQGGAVTPFQSRPQGKTTDTVRAKDD